MLNKLILLLLLFFFTSLSFSFDLAKKRIDMVLSKLPANTRVGMLIYNPLSQDTLFKLNPDLSMIPASNTKLFTTSTALTLMGGDYELSTKLLTDDPNLNDGIINGNLYLKGYGHSLFTQSDLEEMVSRLKTLGIKKITGNIIGDDTFFDDIYTRDDWIKDEVANVKLPPISALVLDRNRVTYTRKSGRRIRSYTGNIKDPPLHAAIKLKEFLSNAGIAAEGGTIKGIAPYSADVILESTVTLRDIIAVINKNSDNFIAECLFKTIGAIASGAQGNSFYSTQAILRFIADNGIYADGSAVVDGSGISRFNQITPGAIAGVLEKMYFDLTNYEDFYNSLSIAGVDGTLRRRMQGTLAENNFHGKTGTLNGVSSIAGYLTTASEEDLIVSIIFEFTSGSWNYYRDVQDELILILAEM
jgi:serine-type D-Ala-D-Ala carboxypeptidase/endopeptidase (penicillin-binding protein 4)